MKALVLAVLLSLSAVPALAQDPQPTQPIYANYSLLLVSPVVGGGAVAVMHNPKNELEFVDVAKTKEAFATGYVPVRAQELGQLIEALREENARLTAENARLQSSQPVASPASLPPTYDAIVAQHRAELADQEAQKQARRQQMIQTWLMLQAGRPQPYQLPAPVRPMPVINPAANRLQTNCITSTVGNSAYTNCN